MFEEFLAMFGALMGSHYKRRGPGWVRLSEPAIDVESSVSQRLDAIPGISLSLGAPRRRPGSKFRRGGRGHGDQVFKVCELSKAQQWAKVWRQRMGVE